VGSGRPVDSQPVSTSAVSSITTHARGGPVPQWHRPIATIPVQVIPGSLLITGHLNESAVGVFQSQQEVLPAMSLLWPILRSAIRSPRAVAAVDDQRRYTRGKLVGGGFFIQKAIKEATDRPHVGLMLPTSGAFSMALVGTWLAGRVAVPLNYLLSRDELNYVIRDAGLDTILTAQPLLDHMELSEADLPEGVQLKRLEDLQYKGLPPLSWPPKFAADDLATLLYTSGTSGKPKGVMLTHGNLRANVEQAVAHAGLRSADTFLGVLPQFHSFGLTVMTLIPLAIGAKVVYSTRFVPRKIIELMREHRPDIFVGIPSMYGALLSVKNASADDLSSIRIAVAGGEPLPEAVYQQFLEHFDVRVFEGYGLTETSPVSHWATPDAWKHHSVGRPLPRVRHFTVDEQDNVQPANAEGEVLLAGPNVMKGYYNLPEVTAQAFVPVTPPGEDEPVRCFRTGDMGRIDEEDYLFITGRKKEMLIIGGENVFPREIEEVLNHHPEVHASAVIGQTDPVRGEVPVAYIELEEGAEGEETALRSYCREHLAGYKVPRHIETIESLPRGPTGKVLRRKLREEG